MLKFPPVNYGSNTRVDYNNAADSVPLFASDPPALPSMVEMSLGDTCSKNVQRKRIVEGNFLLCLP